MEGNKQEHQLSQLLPSTPYSIALYATKGPLTSGTVITSFITRESCVSYSITCIQVMILECVLFKDVLGVISDENENI